MQRKFQVTSISDGNYCFIGYRFSIILVLVVVLLVLNCACWVFFTHSCVYLAFRYSLIKFAWDGSSHFMMSKHTFSCDSLNKYIGWIILLISRAVVWSFGCHLISFGHGSRYPVLDNIFLYHLAIIWLVSQQMLEFIKEILPKFTKIFILCAI